MGYMSKKECLEWMAKLKWMKRLVNWYYVKVEMPGVDGKIEMDGKTGVLVTCQRRNAWSGWPN